MSTTPHWSPSIEGVSTFAPGSDGYRRATTPQNASARQHPAFVAVPASTGRVAASVCYARRNGLTVVP